MPHRQSDREELAFSRVFDLDALGADGANVIVDANPEERRAIAHRLGLPALSRLRGEFRLTPIANGIDVRLHLDAVAERQCVASLEAMTEEIDETIAVRFERTLTGDEAGDAIEDEVLREPLEGDTIDLGELLIQQLSLSLDPHPRKPGARSLLEDYRDAASTSPFDVLKPLVDGER